MSNYSREISIEDMNKDLHMSIFHMIGELTNEIVAWSAFTDRNSPSNNSDSDSINPEDLELLNTIERDIKRHIRNNIHNFDFTTYDSASNSIYSFLKVFLSKEENKKFANLVFNHKKGLFVFMASAAISYREASLFAFTNSHYHLAMKLYGLCKDMLSQIQFANIQFMESLKEELSRRNKKPNEARWKGHVEQLRRKYLELDERYQNERKEIVSIKNVAIWITNNHNEEGLEFETVRDHLSKARKGIFTNK